MTRLETFMAARVSEVYEEKRDGGHDYITSEIAPVVAKLLPVGGKILDVGCGQGPALEWFTQQGFNAVGISLSEEDIARCIEMGFIARLMDQNDLGFEDSTFDCVWARHVLEHSVIPFFVLTEFNRVLKPNGILYVEVPSPDSPCQHETNKNHYSVMGIQMWRNLIWRAGFEILEGRTITIDTPCGKDTYFSLICKKL